MANVTPHWRHVCVAWWLAIITLLANSSLCDDANSNALDLETEKLSNAGNLAASPEAQMVKLALETAKQVLYKESRSTMEGILSNQGGFAALDIRSVAGSGIFTEWELFLNLCIDNFNELVGLADGELLTMRNVLKSGWKPASDKVSTPLKDMFLMYFEPTSQGTMSILHVTQSTATDFDGKKQPFFEWTLARANFTLPPNYLVEQHVKSSFFKTKVSSAAVLQAVCERSPTSVVVCCNSKLFRVTYSTV